jgi:sialic acid synthase SpsE/D-lyxose ketol-isomerase
MKINKNFNNLVVLDLANNHFGDVALAKKIVDSFGKIIRKYKINSTMKFQFRNLPNFIHKDFINSDVPYVRRFLDTKMSDEKFFNLFKCIKKNKIKTSCTPFDEHSVGKIENFKFDYIKIASVSALDFNLHERVIKNKIPKIISTGGIKVEDIDKIVSFYSKKNQEFALMHCVSIYPTKNSDLNLNFIENLKKRYESINIGWSTHEDPNEFLPASLALSKGATMFEKHVGLNTKKYKLNKYSITPDKFEEWIINLKKSQDMLGSYNKKIYNDELKTIEKLSRGVYVKKNLNKNDRLNTSNIYYAFPKQKNQLSSQELKKNTIIKINKKIDSPIKKSDVIFDKELILENKVSSYLHKAKAMLNYSNIKVGDDFDLEISHHNGIANFEKIGCFLFNIVNREYAKKLLVMLPNQKHPSHFHKIKYETFIIITGNLTLIDGKKKYQLSAGDKVDLKKSGWHEFKAGSNGCIFEEISTTSYNSDSFYKNKLIKKLDRDKRKTYVNNWFGLIGRVKFKK